MVRHFGNGRWMPQTFALMITILWGNYGNALATAGPKFLPMKASLFLWLPTMLLIRLLSQLLLVLHPFTLQMNVWIYEFWDSFVIHLTFFFCHSSSQWSGLGTEYFRILLQSNCGVSVLDFTPRAEGGSPFICLNRLNQVYVIQVLKDVFMIVYYIKALLV